MTDRSTSPIAVNAVRIGRTDLGEGSVQLDDDSIIIVVRSTAGEHPVRVGLQSVDAVSATDDELMVILRDGTRLTLMASVASDLATDVRTRCRTLPELTRALRTFGSRRGTRSRRDSAPMDQRRFFAPLLEARRLAG